MFKIMKRGLFIILIWVKDIIIAASSSFLMGKIKEKIRKIVQYERFGSNFFIF